MVILAIGPHPDDIEFGCFGTLAKLYNNKGEKIFFLILTNGEIGGDPNQRKIEAEKSAKLINAEVIFLGEKDGYIKHNASLVNIIGNKIKELKPSIIFAPFYLDTHQDHVATSRSVISASSNINILLLYETPSTVNMDPNVFIEISKTIDLKIKALKIHKSQQKKSYFDLDQIKALHLYYGWKVKKRMSYYEAFYLYKYLDGNII
jgi:LmbE family N-acetylglucosaminyl deacetylase